MELTRSPLPDDELSGYFRLRLTTSGVELLQDCKKKYVIYFWPYPYIRRFGKTCNRTFFLETGRKCGRWCGHFEFASKSYEQIKEKMDSIVANKNKGK